MLNLFWTSVIKRTTDNFLFGVVLASVFLLVQETEAHEVLGVGNSFFQIGIKGEQHYKIIMDAKVDKFRIRQVRFDSTVCESGYHETLEVKGEIGRDSTRMLAKVLPRLHKCINAEDGTLVPSMVFLSSDGGYLRDGYAAAQLFNEHNVETIIYGNQSCSSSCATAFLGAKIRSMRDRATLSFHSPYTIRGTQAHCSTKDEQGDLKAFFQRHINPEDGEFLFERTMDHCSGNDLWDINPDAAEILGVTTLDSNFDRHKAIDDIPDEQYIELVRSRLKQSFPNIGSSGRTPINSSHSGLSCTFTLHIYASDDFRMFPSSEEGDCQGRPPYFGHAIQDALREISIPIRKSDLASPPRKLQITLTGEYLLSS